MPPGLYKILQNAISVLPLTTNDDRKRGENKGQSVRNLFLSFASYGERGSQSLARVLMPSLDKGNFVSISAYHVDQTYVLK